MGKRKNRDAFTLVELLLVVTIIGILAGAVLVNFSGQADRAKQMRAKADIESIGSALNLYELAIGNFPSSDEGLKALVEDPGANGWSGPYLQKKNFKDPWGNEYMYRYPPNKGINFDLYTVGKDGQEGSEDDIGNWEEDE